MSFLRKVSSLAYLTLRHRNLTTQLQVRNIKRWVAPTLRELERRRKRQIEENPFPLFRRSDYFEWNYDAEIYAFGKRLHETFNDELLRRAFTHPSYALQKEENLQHNGELVKTGDSFISSYIREKFDKLYPKEAIEAIHQHLTAVSMLAHVSKHLGTTDLILSLDHPVEESTLANTFKAIVAALKLSKNDEQAKRFVDDFLICQLHTKDIYELWDLQEPYEYLQEFAKEKGFANLEPRICNQSAVNTILANYQVGIYSNKKLLGLGWGESIDIAKNTAAVNAIRRIHENVVKT